MTPRQKKFALTVLVGVILVQLMVYWYLTRGIEFLMLAGAAFTTLVAYLIFAE